MEFRYQASNRAGEAVNGVLDARDERQAIRSLVGQGLVVSSLDVIVDKGVRRRRAKASSREVQLVLQEFSTLLGAGVTLVTALSSLAKSSHHPAVTTAFDGMAKAVRRGERFSAALRDSGLALPPYVHQLVEAGEATGRLAEALTSAAEQYEYDQRIQSELRSTLVYPLVLVSSGIVAVGIIFLWVVPRFGGLLEQHGDSMPALSRITIATGVWMSDHVWLVLLAAGAAAFGLYSLLVRQDVRERLLVQLTRLPVVGEWLVEAEVGRWASTLAALLAGRVELIRALGLAAGSVKLGYLRSRLSQVAASVKGGSTLSAALREHRALNPTGYDLVSVGEVSGELPKLLAALAKLYETTGRDRMKRALQLIEPMAIIIIGIVIGTIVTAIILAITSINDVPL